MRERSLTIAHTEASDGWGGQEIRILAELMLFREKGHHMLVFAPKDSGLLKRAVEEGFEGYSYPFTKRSQFVDLPRLLGDFRRLQPDVVCTHSSVDSRVGLLAATLAGVRGRVRYRHVSAPVTPTPINRVLYRQCARHVVTTAACIKRQLEDSLGLPSERVTTVATGIRPPSFARDREEARRLLARRLDLPEDSRFLGCVAVLRSWKRQDLLMEAWNSLASTFPRHHLLLVGGGPGMKRLSAYRDGLESAPRIHLVGHVEDPWPWFRGMDVAALPSVKDEGIPQSLLQAMFAECPVVGSRAGGIPEIMEGGRAGLLAETGSASSLAAALENCLRNGKEAKERTSAALRNVEKNHTLEAMGERMLAVLRNSLAT